MKNYDTEINGVSKLPLWKSGTHTKWECLYKPDFKLAVKPMSN